MWFDDFPEQCPPKDARKDNLVVFRLVSNIPPKLEDFISTIRESPHRSFSGEALCNAHGVSVFKKIEDIRKKRERFKNLKNKNIARCKISQNDGLIKETGEPSHVTWWLQTNDPHKTFIGAENDAV